MYDLDSKALGNKILHVRQRRGLTQKRLAELSGMSESALRSYELGDRRPKTKHIEQIAMALEIRPEALTDYHVVTKMQAIQILFLLQEQFGLEPKLIEGEKCLVPALKSRELQQLMRDWLKRDAEFRAGEITEDEYKDWKDNYSPFTCIDGGAQTKLKKGKGKK